MAWGKTSAERRAEGAADRADKFFLKTFREPQTRVRFIVDDPRNNWIEYGEHYDRANQVSYPCAKRAGFAWCPGCEFPLPDSHNPNPGVDDKGKERKCDCAGCQVRRVSSRWVVPAIDEKDFLSLYKIGVKFWQHLCGKYEIFNTVTDCDYMVVRTGTSFNDVSYDAVPLKDQNAERKAKIRVPDVERILRNKYLEALEKYHIDPAAVGFDPSSATPEVPEEVTDHGDEPTPEPVPDIPGVNPWIDGPEPADDVPPAALQTWGELTEQLLAHQVPYPVDASVEQLRMLFDTFVKPKLATAAAAPAAPAPAAPAAPSAPAAPAAPAAPVPPAAPAAPTAPVPPAAAANGNGNGHVNGNGNGNVERRDFKSWTTPDVKDFLTEKGVEYSQTAPRSVLISLAEKADATV